MRLGVLVAAFIALALVGYADRNHTRRISARASSDSWWCTHVGTRCTGFDEQAHYAQWQKRELGYEVGGSLLAAVILVVGGRRVRLLL